MSTALIPILPVDYFCLPTLQID